MWILKKEETDKRFYENTMTGSTCTTTKVYTDKMLNQWWAFENLFTLPFMRQFAATKISSLYQIGLSKDDLNNHIAGMRIVLKSNDGEKYEKAMSNLLQFEEKVNDATNAVKQVASMVCVYNLLNDERVDIFDQELQHHKMDILAADLDAQAFFLKRQIERIETYGNHLDLFSKTASAIQNGTLEAMG